MENSNNEKDLQKLDEKEVYGVDKSSKIEEQNDIVMQEEKLDREENLSEMAGGYVFDAAPWSGDPSKPFEVIDDGDGSVKGRYSTMKEAEKIARDKGQSDKEIKSWDELYRLRRRDYKW